MKIYILPQIFYCLCITDVTLQQFGDIVDVGTNFCLSRSLNYQFGLRCQIHFVDLNNRIRTPIPSSVRKWTTDPNNLVIYEASEYDLPEFNPDFFSGGNRPLLLPGVLDFPILDIQQSRRLGAIWFNSHVSGNVTLPGFPQDSETIRDLIFDEILGSYTCQVGNVYGSDVATTVISECSK